MSCPTCPSGTTQAEAANTVYNSPQNSGNPVYNIPVKVGEPLSTACERAVTVGSIPSVLNYGNFTLVNGYAVAGVPSNGGICNMGSFFRTRKGCYQDLPQYGSNCCAEGTPTT